MEYQNLNMVVVMIGSLCHLGFCYLFIYTFDYGLLGIGYASTATTVLEYVILFAYSRRQLPITDALADLDRQTLSYQGFYEYL